ncbi:unnamed protein product [Camellia sinensis]
MSAAYYQGIGQYKRNKRPNRIELENRGMTGGGCEEKIFVSVRLRPLNEKEIARNDVCDWECINEDTIIFKNCNLPLPVRSMYSTAYTFGVTAPQKKVYEKEAKDVALSVVSGINCINFSYCFGYGQTSSGKTFTMTGITEYAIADSYDYIEKSISQRGTVTEKLTEEPLRDWNNVMELLSICEVRLTIESSAWQFLVKDYLSTLTAAVNFVDLAGSEHASQSLSVGTRLKEGCHINRSLLALGTVICKLSKGRNEHVPFRDSKLTRILQSSLGGNARTAIIRTMSPARSHVEQSRNTLLFASCAKEVTTNTHVNVVISDKALVKHLQRQLARLESELRSQGPTFVASHYLAFRLKRLEKEMIDLTVQRDLAQCQVQDLLQLVGDEGHSMTRVGFNNYPLLLVRKSPEFENPVPETSSLASPHSLYIGVRSVKRSLYSYGHSGRSSDDHCIQILPEFEENFVPNDTYPQLLVGVSMFIRSNSGQSWDMGLRRIYARNTEISESMVAGNRDTIDQEFVSPPLKEDSMLSYIPHFIAHSHEKPSPWPLTEYMSGSQSLKLTKSSSCKTSLMTSPSYSPWFEKVENNDNEHTPPTGF